MDPEQKKKKAIFFCKKMDPKLNPKTKKITMDHVYMYLQHMHKT